MISSDAIRKAGPFVGNGIVTVFAFTFKTFSAVDLSVTLITTATGIQQLLVLNTDYTVALNADQNANPGGTVTTIGAISPIANTKTLTISGNVMADTQSTDLITPGPWNPDIVEVMVDRAMIGIQQLRDRAIKFPVVDSVAPTDLPQAETRAGRLLGFDAVGALATYVVQAATSLIDLAAATGSSLIGFLQAGAGAVIRTLQSKLRDSVSAFDFMSAAQIADVIANTAAVDVTTAVQAAIDSGVRDVYLPAGTYKITASLTMPNRYGFVLRGEYQSTKLQATFAGAIISFASGQTRRYTTIDGITFRATGAGAGAATGISGNAGLSYVMFVDIQRCLFSGTLRFGITGNFIVSEINRCSFGTDQVASGTFKALKLFATDSFQSVLKITDCEVNSCNDDYVFEFTWAFAVTIRGCAIEGNSPTTGVMKVTDVLGFYIEQNWSETNGAVPFVKTFDGAHVADMRVCFDGNHLEGNNSGANDVVVDTTNAAAKFFTLTNNVILNYTHVSLDTGNFNLLGSGACAALAHWNNKIVGGTPGYFADSSGLKNYIGTPTNDDAPAGYVGELQTNNTGTPGAGLVNNTVANVVAISNLPAGDWDVWGVVDYKSNAATVITSLRQGISTVGGAFGAQDTFSVIPTNVTGPANDPAIPTPTVRLKFAVATQVILVCAASFTTNTLSAYGSIFARRRR